MPKLQDNTPVFCTAEVPADLIDAFFQTAYSAPEFVDEGGIDDIGTLHGLRPLLPPPIPALGLGGKPANQ